MSVSVFVLDRKHRPLMPCRPARARRLLKSDRARVVKRFPFTIRLVDRLIEDSSVQPVLVKLDPGSRQTGLATGDMVKAVVPSGTKAGTYRGRVAVRASGSFNIQTPEGVIQGVGWRHCRLLSYNDGYGYAWLRPAPHASPV